MNSYILYAIESGLSLFLLYGLYFLLLRKQANFLFNRMFLLLSLITSLVTPLISFDFASSIVLYQVQLDPILVQGEGPFISAEPSFTGVHLIWGIYFLIATLLGFKFAWEINAVFNIRKQARPRLSPFTKDHILLNEQHNFSFFNWIFIHKENQNQETIIAHEKCHSDMGHSYDIVFVKVLQILFWFNPILFLIERELRLQHEYAVDDVLLKRNENTLEYQQLLLNQVFNMKFNLVSNNFNQTFLKNRFTMMTKKENKKWSRLFLIAILSMAFLSPAIISCSMDSAPEEPMEAEASPAPPKAIDKKVEAPAPVDEANEPTEPEEQLFLVVEDMPVFPGGEKAMYTYIGQNLIYPEQAKKEGIQGRVFVTFVVEKDGSITDVELLRGVSDELDQEALRVIKGMPKWTPGGQRGKPVRVQYRMPIKFGLQ